MSDAADALLDELARLAADVGPALAPAGHAELLGSIIDAARTLFDAAACSLALFDPATDELVFHVASGAGSEDVTGLRIPAGQGIAGWVLSSGQAIAIEDVRRDPRFSSDLAESTGYVPRSILAMPLETDRASIGVIEVLDRRPDAAGSRDMELLAVFARQAALAIESSRVFADMGRLLLEALAAGAATDGLRDMLARAARRVGTPRADLAELAGVVSDLGRLGEAERRTALAILRDFAAYARARRG